MRLERKVLMAVREGHVNASEIAEEILTSPKKVLKALEFLAKAGILADAGGNPALNHAEGSELILMEEAYGVRRIQNRWK